MKSAAALLILRAPNPWNWLTPGVGIGLAAALILLLVLTRLPHRGRAAAAFLALLAAVVLVNSIPENPYRPIPSHLLTGRVSHVLSFASMTRALSDIWPFLAMLASVAMLATAHAFQRFGGLLPCPLCLDQRNWHWAVVGVALASLVAVRLRPGLARWAAALIGLVLLGWRRWRCSSTRRAPRSSRT